jgi:hypothetical protein
MKKWLIVAYPECDEGYLPRQEKEVYAETHAEAERKGFRLFPEYHEVGAYEIEEKGED